MTAAIDSTRYPSDAKKTVIRSSSTLITRPSPHSACRTSVSTANGLSPSTARASAYRSAAPLSQVSHARQRSVSSSPK